jgi:hypothetical protein
VHFCILKTLPLAWNIMATKIKQNMIKQNKTLTPPQKLDVEY